VRYPNKSIVEINPSPGLDPALKKFYAAGSLHAPFSESVTSANGYYLAWPFNSSKDYLLNNIRDWLIAEVNKPNNT